MLSLLLAAGLVWFLSLAGRAVMRLAGFRCSALRGWLMAPAMGLAVMVIALHLFSQCGLPVKKFAVPLGVALVIPAAMMLLRRKVSLPWRQLWPFLAVAFFSLLYAGWPALRFGFDWVSTGNGDMANYCLGATRLLNHGFYSLPTIQDLNGRDYSQYYWFMHVPGAVRAGVDLFLAWVAAVARRRALDVFMPTILAVHLVQLLALGALVGNRPGRRRLALVSVVLLALSPLFSYGTIIQVIAQVAGIALLLAVCAVLMQPPARWRGRRFTGFCVVGGILCAGLVATYPEVIPMAGLTIGVYLIVRSLRRRKIDWRYAVSLGIIALVSVILLRENALRGALMLSSQTMHGAVPAKSAIDFCPFYRLPTAFADLFGFQAYTAWPSEPWMSITIALGALLLFATLFISIRHTIRAEPVACLLTVMFAFAAGLLAVSASFSVFKMAMFIQPALAAALALLLPLKRGWVAASAIALFGLGTWPSHFQYTRSSFGALDDGMADVPYASARGLVMPHISNGASVISVMPNSIASRWAASDLAGKNHVGYFPVEPWILPYRGYFLENHELDLPGWMSRMLRIPEAVRLHDEFMKSWCTEDFLWQSKFWRYPKEPALADGKLALLFSPSGASFCNHLNRTTKKETAGYFQVKDYRKIVNYLTFVHSTRGTNYNTYDFEAQSYQRIWPDARVPGATITPLGRFLLFRVENPTPSVRLRLSVTQTYMGPGRGALPQAAKILADGETPAGLVGHGAANVFVGPFKTFEHHGGHYLALDLNTKPVQHSFSRRGALALFNADLPFDVRKMTTYVRDMSLISEEDYRKLRRPRQIIHFPDDLFAGAGVEFSGIYEDGWTAAKSFVTMGSCKPSEMLHIRGEVPDYVKGPDGKPGNVLTVHLHHQPAQEFRLGVGAFDCAVPVLEAATEPLIRLEFACAVPMLPSGYDSVAARLSAVALMGE